MDWAGAESDLAQLQRAGGQAWWLLLHRQGQGQGLGQAIVVFGVLGVQEGRVAGSRHEGQARCQEQARGVPVLGADVSKAHSVGAGAGALYSS